MLKRGKLCKSEGIKLICGQTIKKIDDKYLGILESHRFKERETKDIFRTEYLRVYVIKNQTFRILAATAQKSILLKFCPDVAYYICKCTV